MFLPLNSFENICVCFLLMIIYSTAGWIGEMIYHSIVIKHLSEKRGFLKMCIRDRRHTPAGAGAQRDLRPQRIRQVHLVQLSAHNAVWLSLIHI